MQGVIINQKERKKVKEKQGGRNEVGRSGRRRKRMRTIEKNVKNDGSNEGRKGKVKEEISMERKARKREGRKIGGRKGEGRKRGGRKCC